MYASYARDFRFPNLDEAFGFFGFSPGLEPEIAETYEVGTKVRTRYLSLNVAVYHTTVDHEIFFDPLAPNAINPFALPGTNVNLDRVRHRGVEVSGSVFPMTAQLPGWLSGTSARSRCCDPGATVTPISTYSDPGSAAPNR